MIWPTSNYQSAYSRVIHILSILTFGLVGGFFVERFGIMPELERVSIVMMLGIAAISYNSLAHNSGYKWIFFLVLSGLIALGFEYLWVQTCFPYGCFSYGDVLGTKLRNTVPWTVFVWWTPLIIGVYALLRKYLQNTWLIIPLWAILLTLIDMVLDPSAVLLGFRSFDAGGRYYNVPRSNFGGWIISGSVGMALATLLLHKSRPSIIRTYSAALTLSFFTWIAVFSGMWLPAILWWLLLGGYFVYFHQLSS